MKIDDVNFEAKNYEDAKESRQISQVTYEYYDPVKDFFEFKNNNGETLLETMIEGRWYVFNQENHSLALSDLNAVPTSEFYIVEYDDKHHKQEVPVSKEVYKCYMSDVYHEEYLDKKQNNIYSLDETYDEYSISYSEIVYLRGKDPTHDAAFKQFRYNLLFAALENLNFEEMNLIKDYYFMDMSEKDIGKKKNITQQAVNYQKKQVLAKLRKFIEEHPEIY